MINAWKAYKKNRQHRGYGILFAPNILASLEDKFGKYPDFMLQLHVLAIFSNPRFSKIYFSKKPEIENVRDSIIELAAG